MPRYAATTDVPVDRTRNQIEGLLTAHGAKAFGYATENGRAMIRFNILRDDGSGIIAVQMVLNLPDPKAEEFTLSPTGKTRDRDAALKSWEQACRASWRALHLVIKAKLEAVSLGISTIEREFMPDVLTKSGQTIGELVAAQREGLMSGEKYLLLPGKGSR